MTRNDVHVWKKWNVVLLYSGLCYNNV